jgi:hypothetical protein
MYWPIADAIGREVGRRLGALVLAALPFSNSRAHDPFRGTVPLAPETLASTIRGASADLIARGFGAVAVINLHGGNVIVNSVARALNLSQAWGTMLNAYLYQGDFAATPAQSDSCRVQHRPREIDCPVDEVRRMLDRFKELSDCLSRPRNWFHVRELDDDTFCRPMAAIDA